MRPTSSWPPTAVVFDLGGVLIDWDPRYLYRTLFADTASMEGFLAEVTTQEWNAAQDAGRPWAEAVEVLAARFPDQRPLIEAYRSRWAETLGGPIDGTVEVLSELRERDVRLLALSNWSAETFPVARDRYPFLAWFEGIVISGEVGVAKPDPRIFEALIERYDVEPSRTVFVDDSEANVVAAEELGFVGVRFADPRKLSADLERLGLLDRRAGGSGLS